MIYVVAGFAGLIWGGHRLVQGAVVIAQRLGVSPLVIGLTLVGFGTSMPELVTSVQAGLAGAPGIAIGNVVGSNIANILLILGVAALICPLAVARSTLLRDGGAMIAASLLLGGIILTGTLPRMAGLVLLAALGIYLLSTLRMSRPETIDDLNALPEHAPWRDAMQVLLGLAVTIGAARLLIIGATDLARALSVSDAVIGLTVVAIGTSLPELVTSAIAARRGKADIALGNVIGSNIFNILGILGVTALITPLRVPERFAGIDVWMMLGSAILLIVLARSGWRISRREGGLLLMLYAGYLALLIAAP